MGVINATAKLLLIFLAALGFFSTLKYASENGTADYASAAARNTHLPDSDILLSAPRTGIKSLDDVYFPIVISFSYSVISGHLPALSLLSIYFYAQGVALWMLMLVEGFRVGNAWRLVSFVTVLGLTLENLGMGVAVPAWLLLHLLTSPTTATKPSKGSKITPAALKTTLLVHPTELSVSPWSVLIGCGVPTLLAVVLDPRPTMPAYRSAQTWMVMRMFHPLWTAITHFILSFMSRGSSGRGSGYGSAEERNRLVAASLRSVYRVAMAVAALSHVAIFTLVGVASFFPRLVSEEAGEFLNVQRIFSPMLFWIPDAPRPDSFAEGGLWFMQWELFVAGYAILVWSFALNRDALWNEPSGSSFVPALIRTFVLACLGGPCTAAVDLIRERDEVLLESKETEERAVKAN